MLHDAGDNAARAANSALSRTVRVCVLGSEGAGKTCFLGGLAVLGEANRATAITVSPADEITARYLDDLRKTLGRQSWPPSTSKVTELTVRLSIGGFMIELLVIDYPGEDFREALRLLDLNRVETLYRHCSNAEAMLLLVDPQADLLQEKGPERQLLIDRQLAHLTAISQVWAERQGNAQAVVETPLNLALVLTKCDMIAGLETTKGAARYFRTRAPSLDAKLRQLADAIAYFPVSATGTSEASASADGKQLRVPRAQLAPYGYEPLFRWIVSRHLRHKHRGRRKLAAMLGSAAVICAILFLLVRLGLAIRADQDRNIALSTLKDERRTPLERLEATKDIDDDAVKRQRQQLIDKELDRAAQDIETAEIESAVDGVLERLDKLSHSEPGFAAPRLADLKNQASERREQILFHRVSAARENKSANFPGLARQYLDRHPSGANADRVKQRLEKEELRQVALARAAIKRIAVVNAETLKSKSDRIGEFLGGSPLGLSATEVKQMSRAAELARRFSEVNTYRVMLKRSGGFAEPRGQGVEIYVAGVLLNEFKHAESSKSVTWPAGTTLLVEWRCGQPVKVVLRDLYLQDEDVATLTSDGPLALHIIGSKSKFTHFAGSWKDHCPDAFVDFEIDGISADNWKALDRYILPGDQW